MKLIKILLIVTLACGTLSLQGQVKHPAPEAVKHPAPAAKKPTPAKQHPVTRHVAPVVKPATRKVVKREPRKAVKPEPRNAKMRAQVAHPPRHTAERTPFMPKRAAKPEKTGEVKPAAVRETEKATRVSAVRMRDPFLSPVVRSNGMVGSGCDTGKRCLVVDQIVLKGIVKSPEGYIAVVENAARRAYFMRVDDPVFNGKVVKITFDTVVFEEQVKDKLGKQSTREVVKKVNAPVV